MIAIQFIKGLKGLALWTFFYPVRWTVQCLPRRLALKIGTLLGSIHDLFIEDKLKRRIYEGIKAIWHDKLSEKEIKRLVRLNLITRYKHLVDSFLYRRLDEDRIKRIVPMIEGKAYLDEALSSGKGAILLLSHFGSFGMLIAGLALRGYRLHQVLTLTPQLPYRTWQWIERAIMRAKLLCWQHEKVGFEFWRPGMYLRPLYRRLLQGDVLVLYGDGSRGRQFTTVNFMGYPLLLSAGPFRIAARALVPLIPAFIVRKMDDSHRIVLEKPIMLKDDDPSDIQQCANQYSSLLSHYVQTYPDHWFTWARIGWTFKDKERCLEFSTGETEFYNSQEIGTGRL